MKIGKEAKDQNEGSLHTPLSRGGGLLMNVQLHLEELEDRLAPSAADLAAFEQQLLPALRAEFHAIVPVVQANFQNQLNQMESLGRTLPAAYQPLLNAYFSQEQQLINSFPSLAESWFHQAVANLEFQLLTQQDVVPVPVYPGFYGLGFFGPGFYGYPGFGGGYVGGTSSSGFSTGSSAGSFASPAAQVMGTGLYNTTGALTLPQGNQS
jgi:hypothetical protein